MRSRIEILKDLISLKGDPLKLQRELFLFSWDIEEPLLIITKSNFSEILKRCIDNNITVQDLENWATVVECRDDLDFEEDRIQEFIFEFANSETNGSITKNRLKKIIDDLK